MTAEKFNHYLLTFTKDSRLSVWHMAILIAIIQIGYHQNEEKEIRVSRSKIMEVSHINTLPTYHKYFKELQVMGYIRYSPSYHPGYRSKVELLLG